MIVLPSAVRSVFGEAVRALEPAFERSYVYTTPQWLERCMRDLAQLWRKDDFWMITEVRNTKQGRALHVVAAAGEYQPELLEEAEAWARAVGCTTAFLTGRRGWVRKLKNYRLETVTLKREL